MKCQCYVRQLDTEAQFSLRLGAHDYTCPAYRESLDPVDRQHDLDARNNLTARLSSPGARRSTSAGDGLPRYDYVAQRWIVS